MIIKTLIIKFVKGQFEAIFRYWPEKINPIICRTIQRIEHHLVKVVPIRKHSRNRKIVLLEHTGNENIFSLTAAFIVNGIAAAFSLIVICYLIAKLGE